MNNKILLILTIVSFFLTTISEIFMWLFFIFLGLYLYKTKDERRAKKLERKLQREQINYDLYSNSSDNNSSNLNKTMKVGIRDVSISKSISARTTGKMKRNVKSAIDPTYNVKGMGMIKNPKRAIKNKVYRKTTRSAKSIFK